MMMLICILSFLQSSHETGGLEERVHGDRRIVLSDEVNRTLGRTICWTFWVKVKVVKVKTTRNRKHRQNTVNLRVKTTRDHKNNVANRVVLL